MERRIKTVLQVVRPVQGGMRRHVGQLLRRLPEEGIRSVLAAPAGDLEAWGAVVERFPVPLTDRPHPMRDLQAARALRRAIERAAPDLIHAHGYRAGWIAALASHGGSGFPPVIVTAHTLFPGRPAASAALALRLIESRAMRWIAITRAVQDSLERAGIPDSRATVISNGIDASALTRADRAALFPSMPAETPLIAVVARLEAAKGVDLGLRAMAMLRRAHPAARMIVVGDGPDRAALEALSASLGLGSSVAFLGWRENAAAWISASDACLIPSRSEGQSIVALEAMALGVPVVAAAAGGLAEMIRDGETGLLAPPGDPPALARAASRLLNDPILGTRLASAARREVDERWSEDEMIRRTAALYRSLPGSISEIR